MEKSTHKVEVVPVQLTPHPNADKLSIIPVWGYTYCGTTTEWQDKKLGAFCPPDSLVPVDRPEFDFLAPKAKFNEHSQKIGPGERAYARIRAKRLRGVVSYGLMVAPPEGAIEGSDVTEALEVKHYEEPIANEAKGRSSNQATTGPAAVYSPKYDLDSFQRYAKQMFTEGEPVIATEKIHGENGRWLFHDGKFYCGSRTEWKAEYAKVNISEEELRNKGVPEDRIEQIMKRVLETPFELNKWWKGLRSTPTLEKWLQEHPGMIVYGELYGCVKNIKYGTQPNEVRIAAFDILNGNTWIDAEEARLFAEDIPWVPLVAVIQYDFDRLVELAEGNSLIPGANHYREGIVVSPLHERIHPRLGRVKLKIVSPTYLEKNK
jgi:RNA ligase (TIGR02306 family)